ncbi:hypothetical protein ABZ547_20255 [Streptomyces sparsogenes]
MRQGLGPVGASGLGVFWLNGCRQVVEFHGEPPRVPEVAVDGRGLAAARRGDFEGLLRVLDPEVKLTVDTPDGVFVTLGATEVAAGARLSANAGVRWRAVLVGGLPGIVAWREDGSPPSRSRRSPSPTPGSPVSRS